jgi:serine/threonine protein kinase
MKHVNVVEYFKFFREADRVFIVMQLIEGASLQDHLNSLADKGRTMDEPRVWDIFVQIAQALRYIHKVRFRTGCCRCGER